MIKFIGKLIKWVFIVGDWQSVYENKKITSYVTKFIGRKNINYDLIDF